MRMTGRTASFLAVTLLVAACATAPRRDPLVNVPAGTYVLVEPQSDVYNAVGINERAFAARIGNETHRGQHWVDAQGRLHMADDTGPCMGQESIWTYSYANNRVTLDLVEDLCAVRPNAFPRRMVYERR